MFPRLRYCELPSVSDHSSVVGPVTETKPGAPPLAYGPESIITRTIYSSSTTEKKETYTYDAQGRATVKTTYNKSGGAWQLSNRYEYTYDTSGKLTLAAYSYWSSGTSSWTETLRDAWSWGTHGPTNIDHSTNYTGSWKVTGKTIYEYDTAGRLSAMLKKGITTTGQFKLDSRKDFSYSADGRLGTLESGYDSSGTWKQNKPVWHAYLDGRLATISRSATSQRDVFAYLADGRIDRVVKDTYYTYSGPTGLTGKRVYTYDAQKRLEKVQTYAHDLKTDTWTLSGEVLITHTTAGSSHFFEQDPYPLRQWLIDWYGVGEPNRYATP